MKAQASVGNLPKNVDVRDRCYSLKITADNGELEQELLARIHHALFLNGGPGWLLEKLRKLQAKDTTAPKSQGPIPK